MDISDLVGFYNRITSDIYNISGEISDFVKSTSRYINLELSTAYSSERAEEVAYYDVNGLKELPFYGYDLPDYSTDFDNLNTSELFHEVSLLIDKFIQEIPEIDTFVLPELPRASVPSINFNYYDIGQIQLPQVDINIPDLSFDPFPEYSEPEVPRSQVEAEDFPLEELNNQLDTIIQKLSELSNRSTEITIQYLNPDIAPNRKTLDKWLELTEPDSPDLSYLLDLVSGDESVLFDNLILAGLDFAEFENRESPIEHLKTLEIENDLEAILGDATRRGFNEDVKDLSLGKQIALYQLKVKSELADKQKALLDLGNKQLWYLVKNSPVVYNRTAAWLFVSYFSLVDMTNKIYLSEIKTVEEQLNSLKQLIRYNEGKFAQLIEKSVEPLRKIKARIDYLVNNLKKKQVTESIDILNEASENLAREQIQSKLNVFIQKIRKYTQSINEAISRLSLYEIQLALYNAELQWIAIQNDYALIQNKNSILPNMVEVVDQNTLVEKYETITRIASAKVRAFGDYLDWLSAKLNKLFSSNEAIEIRAKLKNMQLDLERLITDSRLGEQIKNTYAQTIGERFNVDTYDYQMLMKKVLSDIDYAVTLASMALDDRLTLQQGKYAVLGEYYANKIRGVLTAAHTVVGLTNRILEE